MFRKMMFLSVALSALSAPALAGGGAGMGGRGGMPHLHMGGSHFQGGSHGSWSGNHSGNGGKHLHMGGGMGDHSPGYNPPPAAPAHHAHDMRGGGHHNGGSSPGASGAGTGTGTATSTSTSNPIQTANPCSGGSCNPTATANGGTANANTGASTSSAKTGSIKSVQKVTVQPSSPGNVGGGGSTVIAIVAPISVQQTVVEDEAPAPVIRRRPWRHASKCKQVAVCSKRVSSNPDNTL